MNNFEHEYSNCDDSFGSESGQNDTVVITHKTDPEKCRYMLLRGYVLELAVVCGIFAMYAFVWDGALPSGGALLILFVLAIIFVGVFLLGIRHHRYNPDFDSIITFNEQGVLIARAAKEHTPERPLVYPGFYKPLMEWVHFRYYIFRDVGRGIYILKLRRVLPLRNIKEVKHFCESNREEVSIVLYDDEANRAMEAIGSKLPGYNAEYNCIVEYEFHDSEPAAIESSENTEWTSNDDFNRSQASAPVSRPCRPEVPRGPIDTSQSRSLRRGESINLSSYVANSNRQTESRRQSSNYSSGNQIEEVEQY